MKALARLLSLVLTCALLCSCQKQDDSLDHSKNDPSGLPRITLEQSIDGYLVDVGNLGQVAFTKEENLTWYNGYVPPDKYPGTDQDAPRKLTTYLTVPDTSWIKSTEKKVFFGDDGQMVERIAFNSIRETLDGKTIDLVPIDCKSNRYRFYEGEGQLYFHLRTEAKIRRLSNQKFIYRPHFFNGNFIIQNHKTTTLEAIILNPEKPEHTITIPNASTIMNYIDDDAYVINRRLRFSLWNGKKEIPLKNGMHSTIFKHKGKLFAAGTAYHRAIENPNDPSYPCIWNAEGKPILLSSLCPEIQAYVDSFVPNDRRYKFEANNNGALALQIEGRAKDIKTKPPRLFVFHLE